MAVSSLGLKMFGPTNNEEVWHICKFCVLRLFIFILTAEFFTEFYMVIFLFDKILVYSVYSVRMCLVPFEFRFGLVSVKKI